MKMNLGKLNLAYRSNKLNAMLCCHLLPYFKIYKFELGMKFLNLFK